MNKLLKSHIDLDLIRKGVFDKHPIHKFIFLKRYQVVRHLIFWLIVYSPEIIPNITQYDPIRNHFYISSTIDMALSISLIYLNLNYLYPRYLLKLKFKQYFLWTAIIILLQTVALYFIYHRCATCFWNSNVDSFVPFAAFQLTIISIILGTALSIKLLKRWYNGLKRIIKIEQRKKEAEINLLKSQLSPNFLFQSLDKITELTINNDPNAEEKTLRLSEILKYQLYDAQKNRVLLAEEIGYYSNLLQAYHENLKNFTYEITPAEKAQIITLEPLLFLPILESCIKFHVNQKDETHLKITFNSDQFSIYFNLEMRKSLPVKNFDIDFLDKQNFHRIYLNCPDNHITHRFTDFGFEIFIQLNKTS